MKKVLILGVSAVQCDAINELKKMGVETFACAREDDGPGSEAADHFTVIDILDSERLKEFILDNQIDAVYSTGSDIAMPVVSKISEDLMLPHFVSQKTANICNHKNELRKVLAGDKLSVDYRVLSEISDERLDYPFIMKPTDSQGQRGVFLVKNEKDFLTYFEKSKSFSREKKVIIEKYIDGPEVSINGYMYNGKLVFIAFSDRITWREYFGLIHKHQVIANKYNDLVTLYKADFERVCNILEITNGPVYFQVKIQEGQPYIIEVTPRLDGCHMWKVLREATGLNLMSLTLNHLLNNNIKELGNNIRNDSYELEFYCQKPNTVFNKEGFLIPNDSISSYFYYKNGQIIRPVNGRYEKVGYYIHKL